MGVWVFLYSQKVFNIANPGIPYPLFALVGIVLWQTFVDSIGSPLKLVNDSTAMLAKVNFPRESLILAGLYEVLFNFLIRAVLLVAVFAWYKIGLIGTMVLSLLGVGVLIFLGLGLGLLLTPIGMLYKDIGKAITIFTQLWFFLTPVIYPLPSEGTIALVVKLNPVTPILVSTREWAVLGSSTQLPSFWFVSICSTILVLLGWILYRIAMPHIIARMSS